MNMEILLQVLTPLIIFTAGIFGYTDSTSVLPTQTSSELGLREVSPNGETAGLAIPASGCGVVHANGTPENGCAPTAPDITVNKPIIRLGDPVTISWNHKTNTGCTLSTTVTTLNINPNPATAPDANAVGSRVDTPTGETVYTITCTGAGNGDKVTVKVLPRIQET